MSASRRPRGPRKPLTAASVQATAIRMLARREYGRAELTQRLLLRGAARDDIERALDRLAQLGYLSDARYAQGVVAQKAGRYAKRAIVHALKAKGIGTPVTTEALAALAGSDEVAEAAALWQRRFGVAPANDKEKARQLRFLFSRGYSTSIAFKVLRMAGTAVDDDAQ